MRAWRRSGDGAEPSLAARVATFATALVSIAALMALTGMVFTPLAAIVAAAAGHRFSWRGRDRPRRRSGQALLALLLAAAVVYLILDLSLALFGGALPQAKFALIALAITSFDLKSRRNLYSHIWHSLLILYVAALFAWDWTFLGFAGAWGLCVFAFLLVTRAGAHAPGNLTTRLGGVRQVAPWIAGWLLLAGAVFVALPRFSGRPISVPLLISLPNSAEAKGEPLPAILPLVGSTSGPTAEQGINLRVRGALGDEVVMRVRAPAPSYWRQYVLEQYEGQAWRRLAHPARSISPVSTQLNVDDESSTPVTTLPQTFYIQRQMSVDIPVSYPVHELYFPATSLVLVDTGTVRAPYALGPGVNYAAVSLVRDTSAAHLRQSTIAAGKEDIQTDTALPSSVPARVRQLALTLTAGKTNDYDRTVAIADYLRSHYRYSLDTPRLPTGADAVDRFLFVDHVGFCEQFASALAVMLREVAIPARLVVGYSTGDHDAFTGTFTVHARDAHAWVEVLFSNTGWVPFDASPGFSGEPVAQAPARWFLSDFSPGVALRSLASVGPGLAASAPLVLTAAALGLLAFLVGRLSRPRPAPELVAYARAQRWLKRARLPVRGTATTPREHLGRVAASDPVAGAALAPIALALEARLYASRPGARRVSVWPLVRRALARRLAVRL